MRVVHLIKVVGVAGAEQHLLTLLPGLRQMGIDAQIRLLVRPDRLMVDYVNALKERGVPAETVVIRGHADVTLVPRLRKLFSEVRADIVHTHLIHADLYGGLAARWAGVPIVVSSKHNDDAFRYRKAVRMLNRMLWGQTNAGIAISDAIGRFSIEVEGAKPQQVHQIHYGLDTRTRPLDRGRAHSTLRAEVGIAGDAPVVGMVCRLIEQKGVVYGLRAFAQVAEAFPTANLVIAGDGGLRGALEAEAKQAGLSERVHFLGWRGDIPALMAGLDILLAPSLWEGFGLVLLEAMAQQTAIIGSRVSAIPEVVREAETGLLVPPRDVDGLAEALRQLLGDAPLRQHMGLMGRDRLEEHFSATKMVQETAALYHTLVDGV